MKCFGGKVVEKVEESRKKMSIWERYQGEMRRLDLFGEIRLCMRGK